MPPIKVVCSKPARSKVMIRVKRFSQIEVREGNLSRNGKLQIAHYSIDESLQKTLDIEIKLFANNKYL